MLGVISTHPHLKTRGFPFDKLEKRLHRRLRPQGVNGIQALHQVALAEERMNHAVTDFMQAHDRKLIGLGFIRLFLAILLGVQVMARHGAIKRAATKGAYSR
jgi:hypothetical protein